MDHQGNQEACSIALATFVAECANGLAPTVGSSTLSAYIDQWARAAAVTAVPLRSG